MPGDFALAEREEILSKYPESIPLANVAAAYAVAGEQVSADNARVYLAPADETLHDPSFNRGTQIAPAC